MISGEELDMSGVFEELALPELSDDVADDGGVEVGVLVASRTLLHAEPSVSVLTDVVDWFGKTTFHEKWSVTAVGVRDSSPDWNDPQKICASA